MSNNLRIIYNNLVDLSTTTISSGTANQLTSIDNLKSDFKSKVWKINGTSASITVNFGSTKTVGGIILPFCNLSPTATISVSGISNFTSTTAAPYSNKSQWDYIVTPASTSMYSYGAGTYGRIWASSTTQPTTSSLTITITDTANTYLEFSRLIIGEYWSPIYNTSYGLSTSIRDLTKNERTESGDLISIRGPKFNSLSFDLKYMDKTDRTNFLNILKANGLYKPVFVSLFPYDTEIQREGQHQVYGKLGQLSPISYPYLDIYSTSLELEEV